MVCGQMIYNEKDFGLSDVLDVCISLTVVNLALNLLRLNSDPSGTSDAIKLEYFLQKYLQDLLTIHVIVSRALIWNKMVNDTMAGSLLKRTSCHITAKIIDISQLAAGRRTCQVSNNNINYSTKNKNSIINVYLFNILDDYDINLSVLINLGYQETRISPMSTIHIQRMYKFFLIVIYDICYYASYLLKYSWFSNF